ncbi:hypothetical protein HYV49_01110 [Candidatus Pacearchaeota archaeon]|nr:hypothetical protein [Candidatus Pacearchaeota archaeon]
MKKDDIDEFGPMIVGALLGCLVLYLLKINLVAILIAVSIALLLGFGTRMLVDRVLMPRYQEKTDQINVLASEIEKGLIRKGKR